MSDLTPTQAAALALVAEKGPLIPESDNLKRPCRCLVSGGYLRRVMHKGRMGVIVTVKGLAKLKEPTP